MGENSDVPPILLQSLSGPLSSSTSLPGSPLPAPASRKQFQQNEGDEEYSRLKAQTLFKMVEDIQADSNSQSHSHKLLFLTDTQANVLAQTPESMEKLVKAFDWPKPKLVIQFLRSIGGLGWFQSLQGDVLLSSDAVRGGVFKEFPPWESRLDAFQAEERLVTFMREVLIPLAAENNAFIIGCANAGDCTLSTAFGTALALESAQWDGAPPFTFLGTSSECVQFYLDEQERKMAGKRPPFWRRVAEKSESWTARDEVLRHVILEKYPDVKDSPYKEANRLDMDPNVLNYIIVDTVNDRDKEIDTSKAAHNSLITALFRHLTEDVQSISIKTGMSENTGPISVDMANFALKAGSHVLFLDCRPRPDFAVVAVKSREEQIAARIKQAKECYRKECTKWYERGLVEVFDIMTISYLWETLYPPEGAKQQQKTLFEMLQLTETEKEAKTAGGGGVKTKDVADLVSYFAHILFSDMWRTHPDNPHAQPKPGECVEQTGEITEAGEKSKSMVFGEEWVRTEGKKQSNYKTIVTSLLLDEKFHAVNVMNLEQGRAKITSIIRSVRLPRAESRQGLILIKNAWNAYDVAMHMASRARFVSRSIHAALLLLPVSIAASALKSAGETAGTAGAGPGAGATTSAFGGAGPTVSQLLVICPALGATLLSLQAFTNPAQRAVHFETLAVLLQSLILQFRARVGPFKQSVKNKNPDRTFQRHLKAWREHLSSGTDLAMAEFEKSHHPLTVYKHGQVPSSKDQAGSQMDSFFSDSNPRDDFYSPLAPEQYMIFRVRPTLEFYRNEVLLSTRLRFGLQTGVVLLSAAAGLFTLLDKRRAPWLSALFSFLGASMWVQASSYGRSLEAKLGSLRELQNHQEWWDSLSDNAHASPEHIDRLILRGEQIITSERLMGKSASVDLVDDENTEKQE